MTLKLKNTFVDQAKRRKFENTEIFFECCSLLNQSQFSNRLNYFLLKRRSKFSFITNFRNKCLVTGYQKAVFSRYKLSRHAFSYKILSGSMCGFYRSVW